MKVRVDTDDGVVIELRDEGIKLVLRPSTEEAAELAQAIQWALADIAEGIA